MCMIGTFNSRITCIKKRKKEKECLRKEEQMIDLKKIKKLRQ